MIKVQRVLIADNTHETRHNMHVMLSTVKSFEVVAITLDYRTDEEALKIFEKAVEVSESELVRLKILPGSMLSASAG